MSERKVSKETTLPEKLAVESVYNREEIQASATSFGERPEVVAGALYLLEGDMFTRRQVESAIKKFKTREVK
ncbi:oligoribonuclease [Rummeliibacillus sp. POC4]|uniref:oligoribonuclease n=1 Tax=Rummeliibacillus sp. POC4 TaxID=2305899 RepID=UPI000E6728DA|nr:oligoribonuclease [Rummeliibacillus sp. POC4]RIJ63606.1 oligoribonuclease [Rummeliibacillus sp. POC4]